MLRQEQMAILGGFLTGDEVITSGRYDTYLKDLMAEFDPFLRAEAISEYNSSLRPELYHSLELLYTTSEKALENINKVVINSYAKGGITTDEIESIRTNAEELDTYRINKSNAPISLDDVINNDVNPILYSTNCPYIDSVIGVDGFEEGRLYVLASKAKGGKSIWLQNLANYLKSSNPNTSILYLSLENSYHDIASRAKLMATKQSNYDVLYNHKITINDIDNLAKNYKIIILDYLGRITPDKSQEKDSLYQIYGDFTDKLHFIADKHKSVIITACQLNRSAISVFKDNDDFVESFLKIDQDSLSDSMGIIRNADSVSVIWLHENSFYIHNVASRIQTIHEASVIEAKVLNKKPTIQIERNIGGFIC